MEPKVDIAPAVDLTAEKNARCIPMARELLKIVADLNDLAMGDGITAEEIAKYYQDAYVDKILPYLLEKNLRLGDLGFLFKLMHQAIDQIQFVAEATLIDTLLNRATALKWGKNDTDEVTVNELDAYLKDHYAKSEDISNSVDKS